MPLISYHFTLSIRISNKLYGGHNILEPGEHCHPLRTLMDSPGSRFRMFRRITPTILLRFAVRSLSHASPTFVGWATLNFWVSLFSHTLSPTLPHRVNCPVKLYLVATLPYSLSPMDCEPYKEKPHRSKPPTRPDTFKLPVDANWPWNPLIWMAGVPWKEDPYW